MKNKTEILISVEPIRNVFSSKVLLVLLVIGLCNCNEPPTSLPQNITPAIEILMDTTLHASDPFCNLQIFNDKSGKPMPDETALSFKPIQIREIQITDPFLYKFEHLPQPEIKSDTIRFIIGFDTKGKKVACFDTNNDGKFSGETVYNVNNAMPVVKINNLNIVENNIRKKGSMYLQPMSRKLIKVLNEIPDEENKGFNLTTFMVPSFLTGSYNFDSLRCKFAIFNYSKEPVYTSRNTSLVITTSGNPFLPCDSEKIKYKVGDTIYLENKLLKFDSVTIAGNKIFIRDLGTQTTNFGVEKDNYALPITAKDILTSTTYSTPSIKKFILLDFWGTWCGPCVELTGELKEINNTYKNEAFQLISIANDKSEGIVKDFLRKENIGWVNFYSDPKRDDICNRYKIQTYPTFILINPDGKIISRGVGSQELNQIKGILSEKLKR